MIQLILLGTFIGLVAGATAALLTYAVISRADEKQIKEFNEAFPVNLADAYNVKFAKDAPPFLFQHETDWRQPDDPLWKVDPNRPRPDWCRGHDPGACGYGDGCRPSYKFGG